MDEQQAPQKLHLDNEQPARKKKGVPLFSIILIALIIMIGVVYFMVIHEGTTNSTPTTIQNTAPITTTNTNTQATTNTTTNTTTVNQLPAEIDTTDLDAALKAVDTATNEADTSFNEFENINADDDATLNL